MLLRHRSESLELMEPVKDDVDIFVRRDVSGRNHQKPLAIGRDVV